MKSPLLRSCYEFTICCEELTESFGLIQALRFNTFRYLDDQAARLKTRHFDGVFGTGDYPGCMFSAYLAERLGLISAGIGPVVQLSHKWHSRRIQQRVVPEATPAFALLNPIRLREPAELDYPFFVKPVKGTMSIRACMVNNYDELQRALAFTWKEMVRGWVLLRPFAQLQQRYVDTPTSVTSFIAEAPLYGVQVTVDGFVQNGLVTIMGIVDSVMYPGTISFQRFQYPSLLSDSVQLRMEDIARRVMSGSGLNHSCFNIEMFFDAERDAISIIEINPRMSYQFADLFERVDGRNSFEIQLELALGQQPSWSKGRGPDRCAASFVMRRFSDARATRVPGPEELARIAERFPRLHAEILCSVGERLSDHDQDIGSFRYCIVNMAAQSWEELSRDYREAEKLLRFDWE